MSNIVKKGNDGLVKLEKMAEYIVRSRLFGMQTKEQAIALMLLAEAEGMHPMQAIKEYHIIQGRPALRADAMLARFLQAGGKVKWLELTDERVRAEFSHPQGGTAVIEWDINRAKRAGLLDKTGSNWKRYPRQMLRARVISEGIRTVYPVIVVGVYTPEEVEDFVEDEVKEVQAEVVEDNKWTVDKIKEVIDEPTKEVIKKKKMKIDDVIKIFEKHDGDLEKIKKELGVK